MEKIDIVQGTKEERYLSIVPQIEALVGGESDIIANMANITAVLKEVFDLFWVGFYIVKQNDEGVDQLVLGPFQGPLACTRISYERGVCGTSWAQGRTLIVPDVEEFPGHIACSSLSKSEIVVPLFYDGKVKAVLDIDSKELNSFDEIDSKYLQQIVSFLYN